MSENLLSEASELLLIELLQPEDAVSALVAFQRKNHPDRFQDVEAKKKATERFKKAGEILQRMQTSLERSEAAASGTALKLAEQSQLIRSELEISRLLQEAVNASDELRSARLENETLRSDAAALRQQLAAKRKINIDRARDGIIQPYRLTGKTIAAVGIMATLTAVYAILSQVEVVTSRVLAPLGLASVTIGLVLFGLFLTTVLVTGYRYIQVMILSHLVVQLCTTAALRRFVLRIRPEGTKAGERSEFTEHDVVEFVMAGRSPQSLIDRLLRGIRLSRFSDTTVDLIKDLLLAHMLDRGLIEPGRPDALQRVFRIKERSGCYT